MAYTGLDGVRGGKLSPRGKHMAGTVNGFMAILKRGRICSGASDNGACTVWRTDKGTYRCDFGQFRQSVNHVEVKSKADVRRWLKEWLPKMNREVTAHDALRPRVSARGRAE